MDESDFQEKLAGMLAQVTAAITNTALYSPAHPQVSRYIDKAHAYLEEILKFEPEVTVLLIGDDLVAQNRPIAKGGSASFASHLIKILKKKAVERLTFVAGLPKSELQALIRDLASPDSLSVRSTPFIKLGKVELRVKEGGESTTPGTDDAPEAAMQELIALTAAELDELKALYLRIKKHKKIDIRGVDDMVKNFINGFRQEINPLSLLARLKSVHEYTFTHVTNVCILTMGQAQSLGFTSGSLHQIGVASLLHDVGKIFVPDEILNKPGKLTDDERKIIETHTVKGARYLMGIDGIPKLAVLSALEHHLKFDGSGYPSIKGGWRPNITSQMISVADVFDAMRSKRSYQGDIPIEKVVDVLRKGSGVSFNPELVDHFLRLIRYPAA
jgi:HD-GYP domain-containing protein (c-di-GMP phosphodiesterase class II)